jgi:hypothetical protein
VNRYCNGRAGTPRSSLLCRKRSSVKWLAPTKACCFVLRRYLLGRLLCVSWQLSTQKVRAVQTRCAGQGAQTAQTRQRGPGRSRTTQNESGTARAQLGRNRPVINTSRDRHFCAGPDSRGIRRALRRAGSGSGRASCILISAGRARRGKPGTLELLFPTCTGAANGPPTEHSDEPERHSDGDDGHVVLPKPFT